MFPRSGRGRERVCQRVQAGRWREEAEWKRDERRGGSMHIAGEETGRDSCCSCCVSAQVCPKEQILLQGCFLCFLYKDWVNSHAAHPPQFVPSSNFSLALRSSSCFTNVFMRIRLLKMGRRSFFSCRYGAGTLRQFCPHLHTTAGKHGGRREEIRKSRQEGAKKKGGWKQSFTHNTNLLFPHYGEGTPRKLFAKPCHLVPQLGCLLVAFIIGSLLQLHLCSSQWCTVTLTICGTFHSTCAWDCAWLQSSTLCI